MSVVINKVVLDSGGDRENKTEVGSARGAPNSFNVDEHFQQGSSEHAYFSQFFEEAPKADNLGDGNETDRWTPTFPHSSDSDDEDSSPKTMAMPKPGSICGECELDFLPPCKPGSLD
jgi:hypothetical protein